MARIFLTHPPEPLANYYGDRAVAGLKALGEVRFNTAGRELTIPELIEAARLDGAGPIRVFTLIVLPLSGPLVAVLVLLTLLGSWNDFAWPLIALKDPDLYTLPVGLLYLKGQTNPDYNGIMALAVISVLPMVALFLAFQRFFVQGFVRSGVR